MGNIASLLRYDASALRAPILKSAKVRDLALRFMAE